MTLLELYEKLCTGEIKLDDGLCSEISFRMSQDLSCEFSETMGKCRRGYMYVFDNNKFNYSGFYISEPGVMTPERETFLLLFAAYKGEL